MSVSFCTWPSSFTPSRNFVSYLKKNNRKIQQLVILILGLLMLHVSADLKLIVKKSSMQNYQANMIKDAMLFLKKLNEIYFS